MNINDNRQNAHHEIDHIFNDLLPARGMGRRPSQIRLSHQMLDAMIDKSIALCDAGTGIGKTYAYLVAGAVFHRFRTALGLESQPLLISTSSIALQDAVMNDYLPFLSGILLADDLLDTPLRAVIRKGKSHYVCDARLDRRLRAVNLKKKNPQAGKALLSLRNHLDTDMAAHLSGYDRERVCVPQICDCGREGCRYSLFLEMCNSDYFHFQICNQNLLLADAIHRSVGRRPIFPEYSGLIIDEAHKLPEAARQMFGITLTADDLRSLIHALRCERFLLASETLEEAAGPLLRELSKPWDADRPFSHFAKLLAEPSRTLPVIHRQINNLLTPSTRKQLEQVSSKAELFSSHQPEMVFFTAENERNSAMLCATVSDLTAQFRRTLWWGDKPAILTSGTLAVGQDFRHFKKETGLLTDSRVRESVAPSPFDYSRNCLLYLPKRPPHQDGKSYYDDLAEEVVALLDAAHGHALALFTSYAAMSAVKERLRRREKSYPLFTLGRNSVHTMEQFKASPGSVLLATGAAWEGFDFPGDCVSLLILPKLPFPIPDALKEKEREKHPDLHSFLRAVVVPEMQIKLRQGFGRAIRTETDTCVVAILDERAAKGRRYFPDVMAALPEMPITSSLSDVERFIRAVKSGDYFMEAAA